MLSTYYVICVIYCFYQLSNRYRKDMMPGGLGVTPAMDAIMVILGWVLAPIDFFLTWVRLYKEAEEARRRGNKQILNEDDEKL
jgi:hypothetical protein